MEIVDGKMMYCKTILIGSKITAPLNQKIPARVWTEQQEVCQHINKYAMYYISIIDHFYELNITLIFFTKADNGSYLYIEASNPRVRGDKARLISPIVVPDLNARKIIKQIL